LSDPGQIQSVKTAGRLILGVYPQKQEGLFMQRIKIPGGRISWQQWRKVCLAAQTFTNGTPLHTTTRQDIELHNIAAGDIQSLQQELCRTGLNFFGACGDMVRNITLCGSCDIIDGSWDLLPIVHLLNQQILSQKFLFNLPRKFKISFSACPKACAKPWINDLGFIAQQDGTFTLIGAGSLGPKPALGIELCRNLPAKEILPVCMASLELFQQYGDKTNRRTARLRHIRERISDDSFKKELDKKFNKKKEECDWPDIVFSKGSRTTLKMLRLQLPDGNISPADGLLLADIYEATNSQLRINIEHGLEIFAEEHAVLPAHLAEFVNKPIIIACPGSSTCPRGLVDTARACEAIRKALANYNTGNLRINISGCPNNCAQSAVSDIGLVGQKRNKDGKLSESFRLLSGGGNGGSNKLAEQTSEVWAEDLQQAIETFVNKLQY